MKRVKASAGGNYDFSLSARHLAEVVMPDFCPRCYWLQHRLHFKPPFMLPFPGVFQVLDGVSRNVCTRLLDTVGRLPSVYECPDAVKAIGGLSWQNFGAVYPVALDNGHEYRVRIQGVPDLVVRKTSKKLAVFDNKTSILTDAQDRLFPFYAAQVNIYAELLERLDYGTADQLGIVYWQPKAAESLMQVYTEEELNRKGAKDAKGSEQENPEESNREDAKAKASNGGLRPDATSAVCDSALWFDVVNKPVAVSGLFQDWLLHAVAILDSDVPPNGRAACKDCYAANALAHMLSKGKAPMKECA